MAVVSIARQTFIGGNELGAHLAKKLGYAFVTREDLAQEAENLGLDVQRLRDSITRPPGVRQELRRQRDRYVACITMLLCEKILQGDIVYSGHAGHMLLLGIPNIFRISVVANLEYRINLVHDQLGYSRKEAKEYIKGVDVVRERWVKYLYGVDWHNPFHYDVTIQLSQTGFENAAEGLVSMARLDEFQLDQYARRALRDRLLASRVHYVLASDERTRAGEFHVSANAGVVQVTAEPRFSDSLAHVEEVLSGMEGVREINSCAAMHTILYVSERFKPGSATFRTMAEMARRWNSAVELITMPRAAALGDGTAGTETFDPEKTPGMRQCHTELKEIDCCGGCQAFYGTPEALLPALQRRTDSRLLILGDLYLDKSEAGRIRLRDELESQLSEALTFPVVDEAELHDRFRFRKEHVVRMSLWLLISAALLTVFLVFHESVLTILAGEVSRPVRLLSIVGAVFAAPLFAYAYGSFVRFVLRLAGLE